MLGLDTNSTDVEYMAREADEAGGVSMNSVEQVLYEELTHLVDRLATSVPRGLAEAAAANPLAPQAPGRG